MGSIWFKKSETQDDILKRSKENKAQKSIEAQNGEIQVRRSMTEEASSLTTFAKNESFSDENGNKSWVLSKKDFSDLTEDHLYSKKVKLQDFKILKVIGRGSFGKVFLVRHNKTSKLYAMKSIRKETFKNDKDKNNCIIERVILEKLKSNFVVRLHYAFQTPDKVYFVIDYMKGGDLFYHLQK